MSDYDMFCKHYDAVMLDPKQKVGFLKSLIRKRNPSATTLLELACGTGAVLQYFADDFEISLGGNALSCQEAPAEGSAFPAGHEEVCDPKEFRHHCLRLRLDQPPPEVQRLVQGIRSGEASFE